MNYAEKSLQKHEEWRGKIEVTSRVSLENKEDLSLAYTPGVAEPCLEIQKNPQKSFDLTRRHNLVAVVTDGSAVLGLGDIGPTAAMPVMEGKCVLFKEFADIDAFPLCVGTQNVDEIVRTIKLLEGSFGGINLEDISAPRCFEIERKLKEISTIPIFHDDQHGTAVVTLAALINALKVVGKSIENVRVVVNGAGAAGIAIAKLLMACGLKDVILCDRLGAIYKGRDGLNAEKIEMAQLSNLEKISGNLADVMVGADVFVGVSAPNCVTAEMVKTMAKNPILFPMSNPVPEIMPNIAIAAGAAVVGTGRSDFKNQINNVLAFPGIFRGALDARAPQITEKMNIAAAKAIANLVNKQDLCADYIIPSALDKRVASEVAKAVKSAVTD